MYMLIPQTLSRMYLYTLIDIKKCVINPILATNQREDFSFRCHDSEGEWYRITRSQQGNFHRLNPPIVENEFIYFSCDPVSVTNYFVNLKKNECWRDVMYIM